MPRDHVSFESLVTQGICYDLSSDGELIGLDTEARVVVWDEGAGRPYLTGAVLGDLDLESLPFIERDSIERDAYALGRQADLGSAPGRTS